MTGNAEKTSEAHATWRDKVGRYVRIGDRGREPCFVGRDDLFARVNSMTSSSHDEPGSRTIIVSGAPGAGKSAFLHELGHRQVHSKDVLAVSLSPTRFTPLGVFERIAEELGIVPKGELEKTRGVRGTARLFGSGGEARTDWRERHASDAAAIESAGGLPWRLMRERFGKALAGRVVVLLCDEAQTLEADNTLVKAAAMSLHEGDYDRDHPLRIVPVFAGLSDTQRVLRRCGITRKTYGNVRSLAPLSRDEGEDYALRVLAYLLAEAPTGEKERWAEWAVANGDGWPHHLRGQMEAVAKEMLRADTPRLQHLDTERIALDVTERRNSYYEDRVESTGFPMFADVFAALATSAEKQGGTDIKTLGDEAEDLLRGRRNAPDPDDLVEAATQAGVLQHVSSTRLACPIPSMRRWLETGRYKAMSPPQSSSN